ncbi:major facilitator superfamily domain-containing protein [Coniella lustricola]|uniref:Major facilitator superfamily domain-containing protein n=1 Tax=Coniella lustricola TaxID=2025994 RepID=A0A2T2ZTB2_9PEZI|nr:major facilitator superfamily domain-containing protein [Coniella lustricola]
MGKRHRIAKAGSEAATTRAAPSETSPLLGARPASASLHRGNRRDVEAGSGNGRDDNTNNNTSDDDDVDDNDKAHHHVTTTRAVCICLSIGVLMFMQAANLSGMTIIQGHVAADLDAYERAMWFTSAYMIVMASASPLAGRLATIFSLATMVLCAAVLFALGAVLSSRAASFAAFVAGRALTGAGGGCIMTLALVLVLQLASRKRRGLFVGMVNAVFTVGVSAGAVVFGALLPVLGWRELFLVQAPLALVAGVAVYFSIADLPPSSSSSSSHGSKPPSSPLTDDDDDDDDDDNRPQTTFQKLKTIDYAGALSLTATIVLFLYGLAAPVQPVPLLAALVTFLFFLLNEYRLARDPLIPVALLQSRGVLLSCLAQLGLMAARWTVLFYAPVFVLAVRGLPPTLAGAVLVPTNLGFALGGVLVGWLHIRRAGSFYLPCLLAIAAFAASLAGLASARVTARDTAAWGWAGYIVCVFANGFATGAALNYTLAQLLHVLAHGHGHGKEYIATGLLATFRGFAGSFGTSLGGSVFGRALRRGLEAGFARLDGVGGAGGAGGPTTSRPLLLLTLSEERKRLITRLVGSPNLVFAPGVLSEAERAVAVSGYEGALRTVYRAAVAVTLLVLVLQAGTFARPVDRDTEEQEEEEEEVVVVVEEEEQDEDEDEEFREEIAEHDARMEA